MLTSCGYRLCARIINKHKDINGNYKEMKKTFFLPAMQVVKMTKNDVIMTSTKAERYSYGEAIEDEWN